MPSTGGVQGEPIPAWGRSKFTVNGPVWSNRDRDPSGFTRSTWELSWFCPLRSAVLSDAVRSRRFRYDSLSKWRYASSPAYVGGWHGAAAKGAAVVAGAIAVAPVITQPAVDRATIVATQMTCG